MRALLAHRDGYVDRDGIRLFYEVYGQGDPTVALVPTWCLFHSRFWKMQIPYLSRHFRVVTYDPRGNGRSDRPVGKENYSWRHYLGDLHVRPADGNEAADLTSGVAGMSQAGHRPEPKRCQVGEHHVQVDVGDDHHSGSGCHAEFVEGAGNPDRTLGYLRVGEAAAGDAQRRSAAMHPSHLVESVAECRTRAESVAQCTARGDFSAQVQRPGA
ncbi:MAG: hypothetical protein L0Z47_10225 [Actinobacteria bacterium]|nr:hypothetical protein [Actinomycetota bacterium]